jgi:hypothetical protein
MHRKPQIIESTTTDETWNSKAAWEPPSQQGFFNWCYLVKFNQRYILSRYRACGDKNMSGTHPKREDPTATLKRVRDCVLRGGRLLLDSLNADELAAAQTLIFADEAEIVSEACKPFLVAKLDRIIIS